MVQPLVCDILGKTANSHLHAPSYLYRRGNIYYFRYVLSAVLRGKLGGSEIRLSLRTAYLREARFLANALHTALFLSLQGVPMLMLQDIKDRLAKLLLDLTDAQAQRFESFENEPFFQMLYGDLSASQFREDQKRLYSDREQQEETYRSWLREKCYQPLTDSFDEKKLKSQQSEPFHSEKFFAMFAERHGAYLVSRKYFTKEELDRNKAKIGKALMQVSMLFNDYTVEDEAGNILGAQKILSDFLSTTSPKTAEQQAPDAGQQPPQMHYSEAVEKYISAKLLEKAWKEKNVKDIRARLNNFIDINGDIPLADITREDMRSFMNVLQKLPPNRSKAQGYKNKSISEILAMSPKQTLNVATVNTILDALSSLFEWYVREGKLQSNPAKGLQVKDTRLAIDLREAFPRSLSDKAPEKACIWKGILI